MTIHRVARKKNDGMKGESCRNAKKKTKNYSLPYFTCACAFAYVKRKATRDKHRYENRLLCRHCSRSRAGYVPPRVRSQVIDTCVLGALIIFARGTKQNHPQFVEENHEYDCGQGSFFFQLRLQSKLLRRRKRGRPHRRRLSTTGGVQRECSARTFSVMYFFSLYSPFRSNPFPFYIHVRLPSKSPPHLWLF